MLKVKNISKTYKAPHTNALKGITLNIKKGEFVALLWPNWAWKSTFINTLIWNTIKDSGDVIIWWIDLDTSELETKKIVWVVPQEINYDSFFTVNELLINQSWYFWVSDNQHYIDYLLEKLSLIDKKHTNTRQLSGWMKRRLLIAKALVHKPKFFILDEPTAWVDVELRQSLYSFLRQLHKDWLTILLTTHYLEEAETLCDRIVIINDWEILLDWWKLDIKKKLGSSTTVSFSFSKNINISRFSFLSGFDTKFENWILLVKTKKDKLDELFGLLSENKVKYSSVSIQEENLEDIFLKVINKK